MEKINEFNTFLFSSFLDSFLAYFGFFFERPVRQVRRAMLHTKCRGASASRGLIEPVF